MHFLALKTVLLEYRQPKWLKNILCHAVLIVMSFLASTSQVSAQWTLAGGPGFASVKTITTDANGNLIAGCDDRMLGLTKSATSWTVMTRRAAWNILWRDQNSYLFGNTDGIQLFDARDSSVTSLQSGQALCLLAGADSTVFCGANSGLLISRDNGKTWTTQEGFTLTFVLGLARDASGFIIAGVSSQIGHGGGLFRSTDNGRTWNVIAFAQTYGDKVWVSSKNTYFYHNSRSTDNGLTWSKILSGDTYGFTNMAFPKGDTIYASLSNRLYISLDDGINWTFVDSTKSMITSLHAAQSGALYVGTSLSGVYVKMPGETFLRSLTTRGFPNGTVFTLAVDSVNAILAGASSVSDPGGVYRARDNGQTWEYLPLGLLEARSVIRTPNRSILVGNVYGGIFKSTDNGRTWSLKGTELQSNHVWSLALDSKGNIFAGLVNYGVAVSSDNGDTWAHSVVRIQTYAGWSLAAAPDGGMYVGTQGGIFYSSDLGQNWRELGLPGAVVNTILLTPNGSIFLGSEAGDIWRSTNKGANWSNVVGPPFKGKPKCSVVNSRGHIFIGTNGEGVFRSTDNGNTWNSYSEGLTEKTINALAIDSAGFLLVATTGDGLFRSIQSTTSIGTEAEPPRSYALLQNYPNPFNPSTTIEYQIPGKSHVTMEVFDILGRQVATLVDAQQEAGTRGVKFSAGNLSGGLYFCRLKAGDFVQTLKLLLIK